MMPAYMISHSARGSVIGREYVATVVLSRNGYCIELRHNGVLKSCVEVQTDERKAMQTAENMIDRRERLA